MKFSIAAISALVLSSAVTYTTADSYSDAMKSWCGGLAVTAPTASTVAVAGQKAKITVTRKADQRTKKITGLDLYSVDSAGKAKYVQNVWSGSYALNTKATISDQIPSNVKAGLYYYRVWVTNMINNQHGPDCIETSRTFKVTTGSHTNAAGDIEYAESLHDNSIYPQTHQDGCFGLSVDYPQEGSTFRSNDHLHLQVNRDAASQTDALTKIDLYKGDTLVNTAWEGSESFQNSFTLKDHLVLNDIDASADYHYKVYVTSKSASTCTFESKNFKISN
ncbi:hypothetical protein V8B55DRAFT_1515787 [Mucor lusitanicus]|uniref:Intradiol ring-cleavage dioxygenases domain-containing protein n=2 Tax=Mucor circinelloides f. lusitanicus TaxID=29924 RepID=A0A168KYL5_MUCCL|nr:hypothetical protein FB192DRAFT_1400113 [Mucor lusitanicus]OAD02924.1 hypothetical protein MUCCIDRAFT_156010 [Mucor lusitanicus CBS 277.49]